MTQSEWIDISYPIEDGMLYWPQEPEPPSIITRSSTVEEEGTVTMTEMVMNTHHGTHVDSPRHFMPEGIAIDEMPLDTIMGPARIIEIKDKELVKPEELEPHDIQPGEKILFKTVNSSYYRRGKFVEDFVHLRSEAASFLKEKRISVVGIDYLAIGSFKDRLELIKVHRILLSSGIWIIEALDLSNVTQGRYEIICLPVRIAQGDAAQARAIVRPI
jgi:arylformamidase